jgi:uncharacterized membrane protein YoaK (UPF0700 family)
MSTLRKTLHGSLKKQLTDVTTGLYMTSSTCSLADSVCFLAPGGVFAEMMTGNLLLTALCIGTGSAIGQSARADAGQEAAVMGEIITIRKDHKGRKEGRFFTEGNEG